MDRSRACGHIRIRKRGSWSQSAPLEVTLYLHCKVRVSYHFEYSRTRSLRTCASKHHARNIQVKRALQVVSTGRKLDSSANALSTRSKLCNPIQCCLDCRRIIYPTRRRNFHARFHARQRYTSTAISGTREVGNAVALGRLSVHQFPARAEIRPRAAPVLPTLSIGLETCSILFQPPREDKRSGGSLLPRSRNRIATGADFALVAQLLFRHGEAQLHSRLNDSGTL